MKRGVSILLIITLCLALTVPAIAESERGVLSYEEIIDPQYEGAVNFSEGLAAVCKGGKWGYIDYDNNVVIPFAYDVANSFSEGLAVVGTYGQSEDWAGNPITVIKLGFINTEGGYTPFRAHQYDSNDGWVIADYEIELGSYNLSRTRYFYGGWVFVGKLFDRNGDQFYMNDYTEAMHVPTEGLIPCFEYGPEAGVFYADVNGTVVLDFVDKYTYYDENFNQLSNSSDDWAYCKFISNVYPFNQGLAIAWECTYDRDWNDDYRFGLIDKSGNWVIKPQYNYYYYMGTTRYQLFADNGLASVGINGLFGAIDKKGNAVIPFIYDELWSFLEGKAVYMSDGLYGYLDSAGNVIVPAKYVSASGYNNGCAVAYDGTKAFLIDAKGNIVEGSDLIDPNNYFHVYDDGSVVTYSPGEYVTITENGKYGFGKISYLQPLPEKSEMSGWAYDEVTAAIEADLVPEWLQNLYRTNISREDFSSVALRVMCKMLDVDRDELVLQVTGKTMAQWFSQNPFSDTANPEIIAAYAVELLTGYDDNTFRPYNGITRQEAAVLVSRVAEKLGEDITDAPDVEYADDGSIGNWARAGVNYTYKINVMRGIGENVFDPQGSYTREQSYISAYRLFMALLDE